MTYKMPGVKPIPKPTKTPKPVSATNKFVPTVASVREQDKWNKLILNTGFPGGGVVPEYQKQQQIKMYGGKSRQPSAPAIGYDTYLNLRKGNPITWGVMNTANPLQGLETYRNLREGKGNKPVSYSNMGEFESRPNTNLPLSFISKAGYPGQMSPTAESDRALWELLQQYLYEQQLEPEEEQPVYWSGYSGGGGWGGYGGGGGSYSYPIDFFFNLLNWRT